MKHRKKTRRSMTSRNRNLFSSSQNSSKVSIDKYANGCNTDESDVDHPETSEEFCDEETITEFGNSPCELRYRWLTSPSSEAPAVSYYSEVGVEYL
jgi:hypothetical protein